MGVTVELRNIGDPQLCQDIVARIEHALSGKPGEWRVSIAGSHGSENWEMKVEGLSGLSDRILWQVPLDSMSRTQFVD
jgi:hypothetical protein